MQFYMLKYVYSALGYVSISKKILINNLSTIILDN